ETARSAKQSFADVDADTAQVASIGSDRERVPNNSGWVDIRVQAEEVYGIKLLLQCGQADEIRAVVAVQSLVLGFGVVQIDVVSVGERRQLAPRGVNRLPGRPILRWILPRSGEHHVRDDISM